MKVFVPQKFFREKQYIIHQLFSYLSVPEYVIQPTDGQWYIIENKERKILIKDQFFYSVRDTSYLHRKYLPEAVIRLPRNKFFEEEELIVFWGEPEIKQTSNEVMIEADIFASAFYMLTRWGEKVLPVRDNHDRFPDSENILVKNGLHYRPIVCEYVELIKNLLRFIGLNVSLRQKYKLRVTHDVDILQRFGNFGDFARGAVNDILRRRSLRYFFKTIGAYSGYVSGKKLDPYDTFDFLMDVSEQVGTVSEFNFIPSRLDEPYAFYDYRDSLVARKVERVKERGHVVGLHGSYRAYNDEVIFREELDRFREAWGINPLVGRQHFLRFSVPLTWRIWDEAGMQDDSTIGFSSHGGFRAGMCYPYRIFDVEERMELELVESPFVLMEVALLKEVNDDFGLFWDKAMELYRQVKRYEGNFILLWHNNSFDFGKFYDKHDFYSSLVKYLSR